MSTHPSTSKPDPKSPEDPISVLFNQTKDLLTLFSTMQNQISTLTREQGAVQKMAGKALRRIDDNGAATQDRMGQLEARLATTIKAIVNLSEGKSCLGFTDEDIKG